MLVVPKFCCNEKFLSGNAALLDGFADGFFVSVTEADIQNQPWSLELEVSAS